MPVTTSAARPWGRVLPAVLGALVTLVLLVVVLLAFVTVPLLLLALAGVVYLVLRPHAPRAAVGASTEPRAAAHGFGSGTP